MKGFFGLRLSWIIGGLGKAWFSSSGRAGRTCQNPPLNDKSAFTLAEVLITLGIIGVVAAMTMPSLISNHQRKTVAVKAKKAYSELYQAIRASEAKNGEMKNWDYNLSTNQITNTQEFIEIYISPFYTSLKLCSTAIDPNRTCGVSVSGSGANYISANGTGMSFTVNPDKHIIPVIIDTNGKKSPNKMGTDYFYFNIEDGKLLPAGWYDNITREDIINGYTTPSGYLYSCKKEEHDIDDPEMYTLRHGCTALLMIDGWEFKKDYPY